MAEETAEQKLARYEYVLDAQMQELDRLRAENERLKTGADAHTTLQSIYRSSTSTEINRIRAASAALPCEKPRYHVVIDLAEALKEARRRAQALQHGGRLGGDQERLPPPVDVTAQASRSDNGGSGQDDTAS